MKDLRRHTLVWLAQAPGATTEDDGARATRWHENRDPATE